MDNVATFSCSIGTTDGSAGLGMEIWFDEEQIFNSDHIMDTIKFQHIFNDNDAEHELKFIMKNKTIEHTQLDESDNITNDVFLTVTDMAFEDMPLGYAVTEQAVYTHDFNGTKSTTNTQFFGEMGCNGTLTLEFTTPVYLWLLENM